MLAALLSANMGIMGVFIMLAQLPCSIGLNWSSNLGDLKPVFGSPSPTIPLFPVLLLFGRGLLEPGGTLASPAKSVLFGLESFPAPSMPAPMAGLLLALLCIPGLLPRSITSFNCPPKNLPASDTCSVPGAEILFCFILFLWAASWAEGDPNVSCETAASGARNWFTEGELGKPPLPRPGDRIPPRLGVAPNRDPSCWLCMLLPIAGDKSALTGSDCDIWERTFWKNLTWAVVDCCSNE
jgi:hypothetical protein